MSIDLKFAEFTADVLKIFIIKYVVPWGFLLNPKSSEYQFFF